jgi:hypothetical protein
VRVFISFYERPPRTFVSDGMGGGNYKTNGVLGDFIEQVERELSILPRVGELITYHPDSTAIGTDSITGRVTGIQHVLYGDFHAPCASLTVVNA